MQIIQNIKQQNKKFKQTINLIVKQSSFMQTNQANKQTQSKLSLNKQLDFYNRAKRQYQNASKPFTYQFNIVSTQPKPKKFMIILNKFIDVFKQGLKWEFNDQDQAKQNYWNQLEKYYAPINYQMAFISDNSYQKKKNKLRLFFGLLLANKKLFQTLKDIPIKLSYLYEDPKKKLQQLDQQLQPVSFFKDGQYLILSQTLTQFERYYEQKKREQKIKQKLLQAQRKKQQEIEQAKRKKQQQQRQQKQLRQLKAKQQRQRLEKQRKQKQNKLKQSAKLINNNVNNNVINNVNNNFNNNVNNNLYNNTAKSQTPGNTPVILDDSIGFIPETYKTQYVHDRANQLMRRRHQNKQTTQLPEWNQTKRHQKNSEILFEEKFKDQFEVFSFRLKPQLQLSEDKKQTCSQCKKSLKQGFYFIGGNQNQCLYTGQWFCNEHMAQQRIAIPWKGLQSFDLRGYPVSQKSYIQIKSYFQKPIIQIKNQAVVVKHEKLLYDFLVLKRQIHLMYDSICDLELMQPLLKKKLNYCLRQNLFSLKNLYDIYNGHQGPSLQKQYDILSKHFYRCERCQKRKGYVCQKCKDPVKIFAFQLNQTHGCTHCRKLYHRKCLVGGKCDCQDDD